jgi:hypothetical protein
MKKIFPVLAAVAAAGLMLRSAPATAQAQSTYKPKRGWTRRRRRDSGKRL